MSKIQVSTIGAASRSSIAAAAATARPFAIAKPPIGIAGTDNGNPIQATCPKCTTDNGVTTSQTARHETRRPRMTRMVESTSESGTSSSCPYQR